MARGENGLIVAAGAPTAVTNSVIAGVLDQVGEGADLLEVWGAIAGLPGVLDDRVTDLGMQKHKTIESLRRTPGSILSGRTRAMTDEDGPKLIEVLTKHEIGTLIFVGGLPALEGARFAVQAAQNAGYELNVLCVPVSPENEVAAGDHCPGYGSAARAAALLTRDAARGALGGEEPIVVLEFGGAGAGWLAAATALARDESDAAPHAILLPERQVDLDEMVEEMRRAHQKYGYIVVVTTDAARDKNDNALDAANLSQQLSQRLNLPARYDRLGLTTSVSGASIAIGDANEAYGLGGLVVRLADDDLSGYVVAIGREGEGRGDKGYKVIEQTLQLDQVEEFPRVFPDEFIAGETNVSDAFLDWARPLLGGPLPEYAALS